MAYLHQTVGMEGAFETLRELEGSSATSFAPEEISAIMARSGVESPNAAIGDFVAANLLNWSGERLALSILGIRTCLLLDAINGADLRDVYRRLSRYDSTLRTYELVREGMTSVFLQNVHERPGFARLYFCSPWINLRRREHEILTSAIIRVENRYGTRPEILVITRPQENSDTVVPDAVKPLQDLGATVFLNNRLHTKMYVREPDASGGFAMAIVGSQNLTRSNYLELGIRINSDGQIIDQLIAYFWEITNDSYEVRKGK